MDMIMNSVMCATADDEPRIKEVIEDMIEKKEVKKFKAFAAESQKKRDTRKRKAEKEAAEAEKLAEEIGLKYVQCGPLLPFRTHVSIDCRSFIGAAKIPSEL